MKGLIKLSKGELIDILWKENGKIKKILSDSPDLHEARDRIFEYLNNLERSYFNIYSNNYSKSIHIIEKNIGKECIRVLKNIIRTENEHLTHFSALKVLYNLARNKRQTLSDISEGFLCELIILLRGAHGRSGLGTNIFKLPENYEEASLMRSLKLDEYSNMVQEHFKKFKKGTDKDLIEKSKRLKDKILRHFKGKEKDWENYRWQLRHIIRDMSTLSSLIKLEEDEIQGLRYAEKYRIPFQITPYYLSLFNEDGRTYYDRAIRAQVIPSKNYCLNVFRNREEGIDMDFMGEKSTNPEKAITRRYPQIVILKPYDSCPQLCVYCQRNWEIKSIDDAGTTHKDIRKGIDWLKNNEYISEVLITGGDPLTLNNRFIDSLLEVIARMKHIERIRIGTRIPVTLPFRIDDEFIEIISRYHRLGEREICIVSHFEVATEVTPDVLTAIKRIKGAGINIYNQQVFTYYTSFKFETAFLRKVLKLSGVEPYYSFNTKGKEETIDYRVPIARLEQERKEEARLLPGIVRTDEPVFNVPKLGKSHLRAWQDHEVIMILKTGQRVYRFYPWESILTFVDDYLYTDVSIYDYLKRLDKDGEDIEQYKTIWYYF